MRWTGRPQGRRTRVQRNRKTYRREVVARSHDARRRTRRPKTRRAGGFRTRDMGSRRRKPVDARLCTHAHAPRRGRNQQPEPQRRSLGRLWRRRERNGCTSVRRKTRRVQASHSRGCGRGKGKAAAAAVSGGIRKGHERRRCGNTILDEVCRRWQGRRKQLRRRPERCERRGYRRRHFRRARRNWRGRGSIHLASTTTTREAHARMA
mmetsp:Transcript_1129/g.2731  ORF Transcript_1129/g.2731 Transcript_1129/m.2731 type:complete len:207 (-) Transcript_1129:128-748(-)